MDIHAIYLPFQKHFRRRRMREFWLRFCLDEATTVLDLGGGEFNWTLLPRRPRLTFLNVQPVRASAGGVVVGDGKRLPFRDNAFDVVYSNSVIEHLGGEKEQLAFARECSRVGRSYYVQTPNKWFLVEPHLLTPFVHWLPRRLQRCVLRYGTVWGLVTKATRVQCDNFMESVRLLGEKDLRRVLPDATVLRERLCGMTKSLIATRVCKRMATVRMPGDTDRSPSGLRQAQRESFAGVRSPASTA
jgi:hypothetical protein